MTSAKQQRLKNIILIHSGLFLGGLLMCFPFFWMVLTSLKSSSEVLDVDRWLPQQKAYYTEKTTGLNYEVVVLKVDKELVQVRFRDSDKELTVSDTELQHRTYLWSNYLKAWNKVQPSFTRYFWNSFFIAVVTTIGQVTTSILAAYAFVFFNFPFKNGLFTLFLATMMIPQETLLIPNYLILSELGWIDTYMALIVPWLAGVFGIFMLKQFFAQIPRDLYDAAMIDGCSKTGFLFRILVPLALPPIITISIFTFLGSWNSLLWPLIVTNSQEMRTIQVGLSYFSQAEGTEWELLMAASTFCILPLIFIYIFAQKYFVQGEASSGLKG
tara:strand:+ start:141 stop:1121 length:981 start_codon:yes stop_codon:yes gene_type:complete